MLAYFEVYDKMLLELLERMDGAFSDLSEDALDWTPDPEVNSITVLVVHTTAALHYWIGAMLGGEDVKRDRSEEFTVRGYSKYQLHELIRAAETAVHQVLDQCTMEDLEKNAIRSSIRIISMGISHWPMRLSILPCILVIWRSCGSCGNKSIGTKRINCNGFCPVHL